MGYTKDIEYANNAGYTNNAEYIVYILLGLKIKTCYLGAVSTVNRLLILIVAVYTKFFLLI
jgi:hypothetical protein